MSDQQAVDAAASVVIVGTGPIGIRVAQELLGRDPSCAITLFGAEPWEPYNRVKLSALLAGEESESTLRNGLALPSGARVSQHHNCAVVAIDRARRRIRDELGRSWPYSSLVLATGSRAHIPAIPGIGLPGVYTFRDLSDAERLKARTLRSRRTVVLGGGLLGLEAARAMQQASTDVTVVEHAPRLMSRQLDDEAGRLLREHVVSLGIRVVLGIGVREVSGGAAVQAVVLQDGRVLACDTLVVATGIRPRIALAREAGLHVGVGIKVNDQMRTSDPRIYAVGECAEHRGKVYGLVAPGYEQAAVAAHRIAGGTGWYTGSIAAARLKVLGCPVFSMGSVGEEENPVSYTSVSYRAPSGGVYRKLVLRNRRLEGAIALGNWDELGRVQEAILRQRYLWPWQLARFRRGEDLWPSGDSGDDSGGVCGWPPGAVVCNCTGTTRAALGHARDQGCTTVAQLAAKTGASTVCGSCRPLLAQLLGAAARPEPVRAAGLLLALTAAAFAAAVALFVAPSIAYPDSVQVPWRWDLLWRSGLLKQVSGFTLLALSASVLLLALRKRWKAFAWGDFALWRAAHVVSGGLALAVLLLHTGFRWGHGLDLLLMVFFAGLLLAGTLASGIVAVEHRVRPRLAKRLRAQAVWAHILLLWPVPALLAVHIVKSYYF